MFQPLTEEDEHDASSQSSVRFEIGSHFNSAPRTRLFDLFISLPYYDCSSAHNCPSHHKPSTCYSSAGSCRHADHHRPSSKKVKSTTHNCTIPPYIRWWPVVARPYFYLRRSDWPHGNTLWTSGRRGHPTIDRNSSPSPEGTFMAKSLCLSLNAPWTSIKRQLRSRPQLERLTLSYHERRTERKRDQPRHHESRPAKHDEAAE